MRHILRVLPIAIAVLAAGRADAMQTRAFAITSDYQSGSLSVASMTGCTIAPDVAAVHSDAVARWYGGLLYVINRFGQDNVQVIDPQTYGLVRQFSVGPGTNPQDLAFLSPSLAYVSRLGSPDLMMVNPELGIPATSIHAPDGLISLARFADGDGNPEPAHMVRVGDFVFVALQRLTNFAAADTSLVAVVDARADTLFDVDPSVPGIQAIPLAGRNPVTAFAVADTELLVGCLGSYGALDGGIEAISLVGAPGGPLFRSRGFVVDERALGGNLLDFERQRPDRFYAIVSDTTMVAETRLVAWSAAAAALDTVLAPGGFSLSDCALDERGRLWVCDNSFAHPGLRVLDTSADTVLCVLDAGLPPQSVVFDSARVTPLPPAPNPVALSRPAPNPAGSSATVTLALAYPAEAAIEIADAGGRVVRRLPARQFPAGSTPIALDLTDSAGRKLRPGAYLVHVRVAGHSATSRLIVIR